MSRHFNAGNKSHFLVFVLAPTSRSKHSFRVLMTPSGTNTTPVGGHTLTQNRPPFDKGLLNPRPTGTPDFPSPTGGGGSNTPPSISAPFGSREKRKKNVRKLVNNDFETISVNFSLKSKLWPPGQNMSNFRVFRDCQKSLRKTSIISGTIIARANPKTAFEREFNSPLLRLVRFDLRSTV